MATDMELALGVSLSIGVKRAELGCEQGSVSYVITFMHELTI